MIRCPVGLRSRLARSAVWASVVLGGCTDGGGNLELVRVTPSEVRHGAATPAVVEGRNLHNAARASLGRDEPMIDRTWQVYIDEMPLGDVAVRHASTRELEIVIPGGLALGPHDVRVVAPGGESDRLVEAFTVVGWDLWDGGAGAGGRGTASQVAGSAGAAAAGGGGVAAVAGGAGAAGDAGGVSATGGAAGGEGSAGAAGSLDTGGVAGGGQAGAGDAGGAAGASGQGPVGGSAGSWSGGAGGSAGAAGSGGVTWTGGAAGVGGSVVDSVTPPVAYFTVTPGGGSTDTEFQFDASRSWDQEESDAALEFAWDWESDGGIDERGITVRHTFTDVGKYMVRLQVTDSGLATDTYERILYVFEPTDVLTVNLAADVTDSDSTTTSLREAIGMATGRTTETVINFERAMSVVLESSLPTLAGEAPTHLFGSPGVVVDGTAVNGDCVQVFADGSSIVGLDLFGCGTAAVRVDASNAWIGSSVLRDSGIGLELWGASAYVVDNDIRGNSDVGIEATGASHLLQGNRVYENVLGIEVRSSAGSSILENLIYGQTADGISASAGAAGLTVWHNTVDSNVGGGLVAHANASALDVRNNAFTANGVGIEADSAVLTSLEHNLYFTNGGGDCVGCAPGTGAVLADPQYIAPVMWDLRMASGSPAIDAGADVGLDVNGPADDLFNGNAPDIGAWESP